jgi:hypothetical protein
MLKPYPFFELLASLTSAGTRIYAYACLCLHNFLF